MWRRIILAGLVLFCCSKALVGQVKVTVSGLVRDSISHLPLPFVNVVVRHQSDSGFIAGTITAEDGRFSLTDVVPGDYRVHFTYVGYLPAQQELRVGVLNAFLEMGSVTLSREGRALTEVVVRSGEDGAGGKFDKKTFSLADNISQAGGSVLESMKSLPGITVSQDGKVQLRGNEKVMILVDGRQTALTGFGGQSGLDNIPASAIEKIEIINNPSARYDANGNAGIINIIYKKEKKEGFNGKYGLTAGAGAWWIKRENYPGIRPQYQRTPKLNPSISLNYRKNRTNWFFQADDLFTRTLNKNEFADRFYDNGDTIFQQTKRNRTTNFFTMRSGMDWIANAHNTITVSGLFGSEKILDRGDEPFLKADLQEHIRLWQFLEDELKTTLTGTVNWQHRFSQPGRTLTAAANYTYHRENEKYFFTNILPAYTGFDSFALISDEHVGELNLDYLQPLRQGRFESGLRFRRRYIPTDMHFKPGLHSPLDSTAGGKAAYAETIPSLYGNYVYEGKHLEVEGGLRLEYVDVEYRVNPKNPVYRSDGYHYFRVFPNLRLTYNLNDSHKLTAIYSERVDRPNEVDIRIFPKYDDPEIIKVGNPALQPQFTKMAELGYRASWSRGSFQSSLYHRRVEASIVRIASVVPGSNLIYAIFQNAGNSYNSGVEFTLTHKTKKLSLTLDLNGYQNVIDSFTVFNRYPQANTFHADREDIFSGTAKLGILFYLPIQWQAQLTPIYQAPDLVPQGKVYARFSVDGGIRKILRGGKVEIFINATDIANTLRLKREIRGSGFRYRITDYNETQVFRVGYSRKF